MILNAPAVFRYTASANPARHLEAARLMGADVEGVDAEDAGEILAQQIIRLLQDLGMPNGLSGVGYEEADIDAFVEGTLPQHRVTKLAPRPTGVRMSCDRSSKHRWNCGKLDRFRWGVCRNVVKVVRL